MNEHILEPAAQELADATSMPPFLYELGPEHARQVLDAIQAVPIAKLDVDENWITVPADVGDVDVRIVKPRGAGGALPTVLYLHGGGWVLGNAGTHDRLVRELAVGANAAVAFVEYDRSPEAHYPVAIEQAYATARWIVRDGSAAGLDGSRLAVAGDSVGGNMAAALTLLAKQRGDVRFVHQSLYYPVTDAGQDTDSYVEFAEGPFLTARDMAWYWDAYLPERDKRLDIIASPLRATLEDLAGLPEAFVLVGENDVLRDEGEAYARRLTAAGVRTTSVRFNGTCHDFLMLNPLRATAAAAAAIEQASGVLRTALGTADRSSTGNPTTRGESMSDPRIPVTQVDADIAALSELTAIGVEIDGDVQVAESTWVIYGHTSYDGEIIVGEYHDAAEASAVLRAAPRRRSDDDRPVG